MTAPGSSEVVHVPHLCPRLLRKLTCWQRAFAERHATFFNSQPRSEIRVDAFSVEEFVDLGRDDEIVLAEAPDRMCHQVDL